MYWQRRPRGLGALPAPPEPSEIPPPAYGEIPEPSENSKRKIPEASKNQKLPHNLQKLHLLLIALDLSLFRIGAHLTTGEDDTYVLNLYRDFQNQDMKRTRS